MKTLRQIAEENGLDKQAIYRFVKKEGIKPEPHQELHHDVHQEAHHDVHQKKKNRITHHYSDVAENRIISHFKEFSTSDDVHQSDFDVHQTYISDVAFKTVVDTLKTELDTKNRQIETLTAALNTAQQTAAAAQALHAGTMQHLVESTAVDAEKKPGWWARLKGRVKK